MRKYLLITLLSLAPFVAGCDTLSWIAYVFAPSIPRKTIEPEFDGLPDKTVAVVIFAGSEIQLDYNMAQLELTDMVSAELRRNVHNIKVVNAHKIIHYQAENPQWDTTPPENLCKIFSADYIVLISLMEFSTREPGSIHLARGRITAEVSLYEAERSSASGRNPVWRTGPLYIVHPEESPLGIPIENDWAIRIPTEKLFAAKLAKNFYKHKAPKDPS